MLICLCLWFLLWSQPTTARSKSLAVWPCITCYCLLQTSTMRTCLCLFMLANTPAFTTPATCSRQHHITTTTARHRKKHVACRHCPIPALSASSSSNGNINDKERTPANLLEQLQRFTTVWADTANAGIVKRFMRTAGIVDVTTNASIMSSTVQRELGAGGVLPTQVWQGY